MIRNYTMSRVFTSCVKTRRVRERDCAEFGCIPLPSSQEQKLFMRLFEHYGLGAPHIRSFNQFVDGLAPFVQATKDASNSETFGRGSRAQNSAGDPLVTIHMPQYTPL